MSSLTANGRDKYISSLFQNTCASKYPRKVFNNDNEVPIYSQLGQAEWIYTLLSYCGINDGLVVEVGAHTPYSLSNSRIFIENGWNALLVEGEHEYLVQWEEFIENILTSGQEITLYKDYVELKEGGIDDILKHHDVKFADILFLDIDGGEWHLLKSLNEFKPSIVCVEADAGFPHSIVYTPQLIESGNQASHRSFHEMMKKRGYQYLHGFGQDLIYASEEFIAEFIQPKLPYMAFGDDLFFTSGKNNLEPCIMAFFNWLELSNKKVPKPKVYDYAGTRIDKLIESGQKECAIELFNIWERAFQSFAYLLEENSESLRFSYYSEVEEFLLKYKSLSNAIWIDKSHGGSNAPFV